MLKNNSCVLVKKIKVLQINRIANERIIQNRTPCLFPRERGRRNGLHSGFFILWYTGVGNSLVAFFSFVKGRVPEEKKILRVSS